MIRARRAVTLAAVCILASACYHQVVQSGKAPGPTVIEKPWTATWVFGLVPAQPIDVTQQCPAGIATVSTEMSVVNWLASAVTVGIFTPRNVTITCASGHASRNQPVIYVARDASQSERAAALMQAATLSERFNQPVVVRY